jgi:AcrR family transcriptional regulator
VPRAKLRTPELRDRVLRAAEETLAEQGPAGFTTRRVAERASTSAPAIYELFGDKGGLVRELFFEGFRRLGDDFDAFVPSDDARADLERVIADFRSFARANPSLFDIMFSRPFTDFDPGPDELRAGAKVQRFVLDRVKRAIEAGDLAGDPNDIAHALLALALGLATQETGGWLGSSKAGVDRRWRLGVTALLDGLRP